MIIVGSAGLIETHNSDDIIDRPAAGGTFCEFRERVVSVNFSFLTVLLMQIFIDGHHEA